MSLGRAAAYRLLGGGTDYLLHLRPAEWPIMAAHTAVGYLLATGLDRALQPERLGPGLLGIALWVICLNGGTLALNSAYDRDEGDVAYLRNPPPPPAGLAGVSLGLMAAGQLLALLLPWRFAAAYALCLVLSVLYSVPPVRLKAVAGADWVINMWGFGTLTPFAGYAATGLPFDGPRLLVLLAFCPLFAALYPLTQLYQIEEDTGRGDRTLAVVLGVQRSLDVAIGSVLLGFALFGLAGMTGWGAGEGRWGWGLLGVALAAWAAVLLPWRAGHRRFAAADHQRGMYRALGAWAVTDLVVLLAWAT